MTHVGDNIKRIRRKAGMNQQELAERCGISKSQLSRLESGEQDNPLIKTIIPIATALGVSLDEIVFGETAESMTYLSQAMEELPDEEQRKGQAPNRRSQNSKAEISDPSRTIRKPTKEQNNQGENFKQYQEDKTHRQSLNSSR